MSEVDRGSVSPTLQTAIRQCPQEVERAFPFVHGNSSWPIIHPIYARCEENGTEPRRIYVS